MARLKKGNKDLPFRILLLAGYLFLFATQVNDRYYSIANFFDYTSHAVSAHHQETAISPAHKAEHLFVSGKNAQRSAHLGVDKRFYGVDATAVGTVFYQSVVPLREIDRQYGILLQVYSSTVLLSNSLRGPPLA